MIQTIAQQPDVPKAASSDKKILRRALLSRYAACGCTHVMSILARIADQASARACQLRKQHLLGSLKKVCCLPRVFAASLVCWRHCITSHTSVCSGIIDMHVHMTGGGGEAGPASRCPEAQVKHTSIFVWQHGPVLCHLSP